jgi:hypothetical protein
LYLPRAESGDNIQEAFPAVRSDADDHNWFEYLPAFIVGDPLSHVVIAMAPLNVSCVIPDLP